MKRVLLFALMCGIVLLCSCGKAESVPAAGSGSAGETAAGVQASSASETVSQDADDGSSSAGEASSDDNGQSTEDLLRDRASTGEVILSKPDFSVMSQEEIEGYWSNGGFDKSSEYALAEYLQDAAFFEEGVEIKENITQGIDTSEWEEPGLHHPDYSGIMAEFDEGFAAMEGMDEIEGFDEYGNEAEAPSAGGSDSKKERYAAIIPESFLKNAMSMEEDGAYMVTGAAEESVFREIVKRAKEAGYINDAMETDRGGILIYGASDDHNEALNVTCSAGYVTVIFSE